MWLIALIGCLIQTVYVSGPSSTSAGYSLLDFSDTASSDILDSALVH